MPNRPKTGPDPRAKTQSGLSRLLVIVLAAAVLVGGGTLAIVMLSGGGDKTVAEPTFSPLGFPEQAGTPAARARCGAIERPKYQGRIKVEVGQKHPDYSSSPPTSGWFRIGVSPAWYGVSPPIEQVMGIPANGGIAIWVSDVESRNSRLWHTLKRRNDVIVVADPSIKTGVVFTAWGLKQRCEYFSGEYATSFLNRWTNMRALKEVEPTAQPIN